jgi:hypothetical protein
MTILPLKEIFDLVMDVLSNSIAQMLTPCIIMYLQGSICNHITSHLDSSESELFASLVPTLSSERESLSSLHFSGDL